MGVTRKITRAITRTITRPTFGAGDQIPDAFSFTAATGVELSTVTTSNSVVPTQYAVPTVISVSGGEYSINGGAFTSTAGLISPGDSVRARGTSSSSSETLVAVTVTIGGVAGVFNITTGDSAPDAFSFVDQTMRPTSTVITSAPVVLAGLTITSPITVSGGEYSKNGAAFTSAAGTVVNGDSIRARVTSSASANTGVTATVTIGGVSDGFTATTWDADASWNFDTVGTLASQLGSLTLAVARASASGAFIGSDGLLQTVAANQPVFPYDLSTLTRLGLRTEVQLTNLLLRSEELDNVAWVKTDTIATADSNTAPDGTSTMDLLTEGILGTALVAQNATINAGASVCHSRFMKRGNHDWVALTITDFVADSVTAWFNLNTGAKGSSSSTGTGVVQDYGIELMPNSTYRCYLIGTIDAGSTAVGCLSRSASADSSTTRVNNGTRYEWGAQATMLATRCPHTSYIKTVGSTVIRNADMVTAAITGYDTAASVYGRGRRKNPGVSECIVCLDDGTSSERHQVNFGPTNLCTGATVDGGVTQAAVTSAAAVQSSFHKIAYSVTSNDAQSAGDGTLGTPDTAVTMPTVTTVRIGNSGAIVSLSLNDVCTHAAIFKRALSDAELQAITT